MLLQRATFTRFRAKSRGSLTNTRVVRDQRGFARGIPAPACALWQARIVTGICKCACLPRIIARNLSVFAPPLVSRRSAPLQYAHPRVYPIPARGRYHRRIVKLEAATKSLTYRAYKRAFARHVRFCSRKSPTRPAWLRVLCLIKSARFQARWDFYACRDELEFTLKRISIILCSTCRSGKWI